MHSHRGSGFIMATAIASLMSSAALAQDAQPNAGSPATTVTTTNWMTQEAPGQWRASKMVGLNVYNNDNEKIGAVAELIIDRSGKVEAVVVGAGGFLGIGDRDVAVRYSQINWVFAPVGPARTSTGTPSTRSEPANSDTAYPDHAVLNMTKDQLKDAPAYKYSSAALAQDAQPNAGSPATTVTTTNWLTQEATGKWRASKMVGLNCYNNDNEKIGDIAELIIDRSGKLEAVVVGAGGFLGIGERDVAVPYSQINWVFAPVGPPSTRTDNRAGAIIDSAQERRNLGDAVSYPDHAVLNMTKDQLKDAPAFKYSR
jgi:sporulation protein YlmC with PRC-barrel domain